MGTERLVEFRRGFQKGFSLHLLLVALSSRDISVCLCTDGHQKLFFQPSSEMEPMLFGCLTWVMMSKDLRLEVVIGAKTREERMWWNRNEDGSYRGSFDGFLGCQQRCRCQHKLGQHRPVQFQKQNSNAAEVWGLTGECSSAGINVPGSEVIYHSFPFTASLSLT